MGEGLVTPLAVLSQPLPRSSRRAGGCDSDPRWECTREWELSVPVMEMLRGESGREGGGHPQEHLLGPGTYGAFVPPCGGTRVFLTFCHLLLSEGAATGSGDSCCL